MTDEPRCRWVASDEPRVLVGRHPDPLPDGHEADCDGCQPCDKAHCIVCGHEHAAATCAGCVGVGREDMAEIRDLCTHLREQAVSGSDAKGRPLYAGPIPGGEAMVLIGPNADPEGWSFRMMSAVLGRTDPGMVEDHRSTDSEPPLLTLSRWEDLWRQWLGHEAGPRATISGCVEYLDRHLSEIARQVDARELDDDRLEFPPDVVQFFGDLRQLRGRLEDVLYDGERDERSQTPCPGCGRRLVKIYAERAKDDHWKCPKCRTAGKHRTYNAEEYAKAKAQHLQSERADAWVRIADAAHSTGRSIRTIWSWVDAERVQVKRERVKGEGGTISRVWVWWPDVRRAHALAATRERTA